ncbi:hypothetical protein [Chitinophaga pinensis]|uniref:Uncharacterized protein n=1 Tax=Chitinophaga pinensis (strain ATCC 43595 / DSM 2588 / LMG 13176 / NBRC 15968 / NCIMB 11800 / UQM 2034) TaxID=485918 RepID=A0A979GS15_CHIPD|nr:hypothetical protein [Chitinophaga pinensis]ACU57635.1 hypothetical protein Cpin_0132 [Chitinophaga pinensis DSM 2588]
MKKAKIVLSAVALFAVVGGAFAFAASKFTAPVYFARTGTTTINGISYPLCPAALNARLTNSGALSTFYTTKTTVQGVSNICTASVLTLATTAAE